MKIASICLLTAYKRRKFKLFGDSSQVRPIDNGITCCYWSASLRNRLRALIVRSSLFKCCEKNWPTYMYWVQGKHRGSWAWVFLRLFVSLKLILLSPLMFNIFLYTFSIREGGCHWQGTAPGPKSHIDRSKKWHWLGRKVTQRPKCHIWVLWYGI